jgi:hypothetical protein
MPDVRIGGVTREETGVEKMNLYHTRLFVLSTMLLPVLAGCESYVLPLGPMNPTITDAKQGQDCRGYLTGVPDVTGRQAMRSGGITKLRSAEYRVSAFSGMGSECVIARGE